MMNGVFAKEFIFDTLAAKYNEYSKTAAYWRRVDHPAWEKYATAATAVLELIETMFDADEYTLVFTSGNIGDCNFDWRKMEVL